MKRFHKVPFYHKNSPDVPGTFGGTQFLLHQRRKQDLSLVWEQKSTDTNRHRLVVIISGDTQKQ